MGEARGVERLFLKRTGVLRTIFQYAFSAKTATSPNHLCPPTPPPVLGTVPVASAASRLGCSPAAAGPPPGRHLRCAHDRDAITSAASLCARRAHCRVVLAVLAPGAHDPRDTAASRTVARRPLFLLPPDRTQLAEPPARNSPALLNPRRRQPGHGAQPQLGPPLVAGAVQPPRERPDPMYGCGLDPWCSW